MYETDLTEAQWQVIKNHLPNIHRKRKNSLREILNAIFYLNKTGCQWRYLPKNYPKWQLVFYYFNLWQIDEIWDDLMILLTEMARKNSNRNSQASVVIVDCQSIKTTMVGGLRGFDGNKKVKGRKRHIAVDTQGNLIDAIIHCANQHETRNYSRTESWHDGHHRKVRRSPLRADARSRHTASERHCCTIRRHRRSRASEKRNGLP